MALYCRQRHRRQTLVAAAITALLQSSHAWQPASSQTTNYPPAVAAASHGLDFAPLPLSPPPQLRPRSMVAAPSNSVVEQPPSDFELSVGKALDTLKRDYPALLTKQPDFSIYAHDIEVVDPSGMTVHGIKTYKNSFLLIHALIKFLYCPNRSNLTFRMCYDKARQNIRVHWNAQVMPRMMMQRPVYVDGISVYELDKRTGEIVQHRIEHLLMNNMPVKPEEGVFVALERQHTLTVPSFVVTQPGHSNNMVLEFASWSPFHNNKHQQQSVSSSLFAMVGQQGKQEEQTSGQQQQQQQQAHVEKYPGLDWQALEAKNKSRQKFGLKPVTPEEFMELQAQVADLAQQQQARAAAAAAEMSTKKTEAKPNFLQQLFGPVLQDTCESNFDCERPQVCCDFGFKKMCCASGNRVVNGQLQYATVPVPQGVEDAYPPGRGPTDNGGTSNNRLW
jgi:hypothetical protein